MFATDRWTLFAVAGNFPAAFTAVYVVGAIAAFGIGFYAVRKAREVNIASFEEKEEKEQD
jgi:hypothetical protein